MYDYRWAPEGSSNAKEEPLKLNDHAMDALRYMVAALDGKQAQKQLKAVAVREQDRWS